MHCTLKKNQETGLDICADELLESLKFKYFKKTKMDEENRRVRLSKIKS